MKAWKAWISWNLTHIFMPYNMSSKLYSTLFSVTFWSHLLPCTNRGRASYCWHITYCNFWLSICDEAIWCCSDLHIWHSFAALHWLKNRCLGWCIGGSCDSSRSSVKCGWAQLGFCFICRELTRSEGKRLGDCSGSAAAAQRDKLNQTGVSVVLIEVLLYVIPQESLSSTMLTLIIACVWLTGDHFSL